ncbi:LysR substrate-binding domain-containing protein, partial [Dyella sp.]|uniref:LysR substrate-binding domain-containing protein n=1 Tax=Dyella sp. TaxID=1869338 RepID=UPI002CA3A33F
KVRVDGQLVLGNNSQIEKAVLAGMGLAWIPEDVVQTHVAKGRLKRVLEAWCPPFPGYHLYYPNRRQHSPALNVLVEALKYRG